MQVWGPNFVDLFLKGSLINSYLEILWAHSCRIGRVNMGLIYSIDKSQEDRTLSLICHVHIIILRHHAWKRCLICLDLFHEPIRP